MQRTAPLLFSAFLFLASSPLFAAISVNPSRQEIVLPPGQDFEGTYTVTNESPNEMPVMVELRDWFVLEENLGIVSTDWLKIWPAELLVPPGASAVVNYRVNIPERAKGVLVSMLSFVAPTSPDSSINMSLGVSLYATVQGTENVDWDVNDLRFFKTPTTIAFQVRVNNHGNVHVRPVGIVRVKDRKKKTVAELEIKESRPVYPNAYRTYLSAQKEMKLPRGSYTAEAEVISGGLTRTATTTFKID